jgi:hypothetical protein
MVWELSPKLKPILTQLGARIDTLTLMRNALGEEAAHRSVTNYVIHRDMPRSPVTGHLVGKGLAGDGLGDKAYLVIDGVDARVHHVEVLTAQVPDPARIGAILTVGREPSARSVDKTIATYAAHRGGFYEPQAHAEIARRTARIPGGDVEGHIEGHVRRLETLRRVGIVERLDADHWLIPPDYLERAAAYDERTRRQLVVEVQSAVGLDRQITADATTWLDRQLVGRHRVETAPMGYGHRVTQALERRQQYLIAHGLAKPCADGTVQYQPDLLATLQRRELDRVGQHLAANRTDGLAYVSASEGATIKGVYRQVVTLTSGTFAVIETRREFTLVPWRPVLEPHRGQEVVGIVRGKGVSWQLGRQRDRGLSR